MNGGNGKEEQPIHGGAPASSRWTPTKEQINILESLYKQGIRTPTADQIQHITNRLKNYGSIEGKNVFYWFQNHKARQRQKQKQEVAAATAAYFYHRPSPPPPAPAVLFSPPNGCRAVTIQQFGFHGMNMIKRKSLDCEPLHDYDQDQYHNRFGMVGSYDHDDHDQDHGLRLNHHNSVGYMKGSTSYNGKLNNCDETLCLFPLEPNRGGKVTAAAAGEESWSGITVVVEDDEDEEMKGRRRFIDFLARSGGMNY